MKSFIKIILIVNIAFAMTGYELATLMKEISKPIDNKKYKNKLDLTIELNRILENMIKNNPDQWIWTHNRWK